MVVVAGLGEALLEAGRVVEEAGVVVLDGVVGVVVVVLAATGPKGKYQKQLELGEKYLAEMDYEKALLAYEEAVKINPKAEAAYFGLAKVYEIMADEYIANGLKVEAAGYLDIAIDKLEEGYHYTSSEEMFSEAERLKAKRDSVKGGQPAEGES